MPDKPTIARSTDARPIDATGKVFGVAEWQGSGPPQLHVHYQDDEAWHVLEGTLEFRFDVGPRETAGPGTTVFVPAGTAHTFVASDDARYLIVLTRRLAALIEELHAAPPGEQAAVYLKYESKLLE